MPISVRDAIKIAKETAKEAGYGHAKVVDTNPDEDEETIEVELETEDEVINVLIDMDSGDVLDFTAE